MPLLAIFTINAAACSAAIFAKSVFLVEARRQEKREFFKSIDWTKPEKVTKEEIADKLPETYYVYDYLRRGLGPAIVMLGFLASQPFSVVAAHVINARYQNTNGGRYSQSLKESPTRNSFRAFHFIVRKYGFRGLFRGLLPTALFSIAVLYDSVITQLLKED